MSLLTEQKNFQRRMRIDEVKVTILKLESKDLRYDKKKFSMEIQLRYGVCERKANEYIKLAQFIIDGK